MSIPASKLRALFRFDPATGRLFWNARPVEDFVSPAAASAWNTKYAQSEADRAVDSHGYRMVCIGGRRFKAHRVIRAMIQGVWPSGQVDHIDGDRKNNKAENLRDATPADNNKNRAKGARNKSGVVGVVWVDGRKKWNARILENGSFKHLGYFDDINEAAAVRKAAERSLGYHENHGRDAFASRTTGEPAD